MDVMIPSNAPCVCNGCMVTRCASKIQPLASCPQCFSRKFLSRLLFSVRMTQKMPCWLAFQADGLTADSFRKSCLGPALVSVEVDVQCKARTRKWISSTQSGGVTIKIWQHIQSSLLFCWVWGMFFFFFEFFQVSNSQILIPWWKWARISLQQRWSEPLWFGPLWIDAILAALAEATDAVGGVPPEMDGGMDGGGGQVGNRKIPPFCVETWGICFVVKRKIFFGLF